MVLAWIEWLPNTQHNSALSQLLLAHHSSCFHTHTFEKRRAREEEVQQRPWLLEAQFCPA